MVSSFSQKSIKFVAILVLKNLASGHFYLSICEKCGQKSDLVARKCGQLATFENKCGHENLRKMAKMTRKMGQNGLKMAFLGYFWAKFAIFWILWPFGHFYFLFNCDKNFNIYNNRRKNVAIWPASIFIRKLNTLLYETITFRELYFMEVSYYVQ